MGIIFSTINAWYALSKEQFFLYPNEEECMQALTSYLNIYESKSAEYKENLKTTGYCLPFDAFPIQGMHRLSS